MKQSILRVFPAVCIGLLLCVSAQAQTAAYTMHTIAGGETLSALAKNYHTTVGDIMRLNGMNTDSKLQVGEKIKIPATSEPVPATTTMASPQLSAATATAGKVARTHTVQTGESLYRISHIYKVPMEKLMSLNHIINAGELKVGQVLLLSDGTPPAPAKTKSTVTPVPAATTQQPEKAVPAPAITPQQTLPNTDTVAATMPAATSPVPVQDQKSIPVAPPVQSNAMMQGTQPAITSSAITSQRGFFTTQFRQNVEGRNEETKSGAAMTFKSASGWADKKFYVLMNDAPPGSIVKIINGSNTVYAKVLWSLGVQKENEGLDFRVSTATAAALNITDEKFNLTVTYFQ